MYSKDKNGKYSHDKPKKDLTGQKFNDLTVVEWLGFVTFNNGNNTTKRRSIYKCKCKCGNFCNVNQSCLKSSNTKSCGCRLLIKHSYKGFHYSTISYILNNYKQSAKNKNRIFELSRKEFENLITSKCYYCGKEPSIERKSYNDVDKKPFYYNGVDRKNNDLGYTKENAVSCCTECNFLKKDYTEEYFLKLIESIYEWRIKKI